MKKLTLAITLLMMMLLMAACGEESSQESGNNGSGNTEETDGTNTETESGTETEPETETDTETGTDTEAPETETPAAGEEASGGSGDTDKEISYSINGETKTGTAAFTKSDELAYGLYVLPEFELTSEEPGKDKLSLKENDAVSMRIELLDSPDWNTLENNVPLELEYFQSDIVNPDDDQLQIDSAKIYEASNDEERVTIYLIQSEEMPLKLTMFTPAGQDYREAFVQMAKTITKK